MDNLEIAFGTISSIAAIAGIFFGIRNKNKKDAKNQINVNNSSIGTQTIQQAETIIINTKVKEDTTTKIPANRIHLKSDKDLRDYINNEMKNLSLIEANFTQLSKKFINASVEWVITIDKIEKGIAGNYEVHFDSDESFSRVEYFIVNLDKFPILKFAKRGDKYKIEAQIKSFDETTVVLDRVAVLQKL